MKKAILIALGILAAPNLAVAAKIPIWSWDYVTEGGFSGYSTDATNPNNLGTDGMYKGDSSVGEFTSGTSILTTGKLNDVLCWGDAMIDASPSCLDFRDTNGNDASRVAGEIQTTGIGKELKFVAGTSLEHNNFGIKPPKLTEFHIAEAFQLSGLPLFGDFLAPEIFFKGVFLESANDMPGQSCVSRVESKADPDLETLEKMICPDDVFFMQPTSEANILAINDEEHYVDIGVDFDVSGFVPENYHTQYQIVTRLSGLQPIPGLPPGVFGLITKEQESNYLTAQIAIRLVSEPTTVSLLGLLLLLLGFRVKLKA